MLPSGTLSTELSQDFRRTLDGLSGVLKLHRGSRPPLPNGGLSRMLRVQSDPTFTRLPAISTTRRLGSSRKEQEPVPQHQQLRRPPVRRPPKPRLGQESESALITKSASSPSAPSSRRLLAGPSTQVGFRNSPTAAELPAVDPGHGRTRSIGKDMEETHRSSFHQSGMRRSFMTALGERDFHDNLQALKASIDDVQSSLEGFHGRAGTQQMAGTRGSMGFLQSETVPSNGTIRAGVHGPPQAEQEVDECEAQRLRLMQYRYVRKIETPPEPLPAESILEAEEESRPGSAIMRYRSPEYLGRFTPQGRKMMRAEMVDMRNRNLDAARDRRLKDEQSAELRALQKVAMYEERMANFGKKDDVERRRETLLAAAPLRLQQKRQWQVALAMTGFFQICAEVIFRFKALRNEYVTFLEKEDFFLVDRGSEQDLATAAGVQLLGRKFGEVARMKIKQEWRLPKQLKSTWCIKFEHIEPDQEDDAKDECDVIAPRRDDVETRNAGVAEEALQQQAVVSMPYPEETSRLLRNSAILQAALLRRIRIIRVRKQAAVIGKSLRLWLKAKPFVFMLEFARKTKQIQKFWRWSMRRLAEVRTRVESDWIRLEREVFVAELRARGGVALQGGDPTSRRHMNASTSINSKRQRRGAIVVDHEVPLVHMVREERRQTTIKDELRRRRMKLLPKYEVWLTDMALYRREVEEWRRHREACRLQNARSDLAMPLMPPCPSHIPSDDDLVQIIQLAWDEENDIERPQEVAPESGANALAEALLRTATSTQMLWVKRPEPFKAAEHEGGEDFNDDAVAEVRQLLALPVFTQIGADSTL